MSKYSLEKIERRLKELFPQLIEDDVHQFLRITTYTSFENKEIIITEGDTNKTAFLVLEGVVRGYLTTKNDVEKTILLRGAGIFVAHANSAFDVHPSKYTYESVEQTHGLLLKADEFEKLAFQNKNIMNLYLNILKNAIMVLSYRVEAMITLSNEERYHDLIKRNPIFLKTAYQKYIATYLGITPVSLSRIVSRHLK